MKRMIVLLLVLISVRISFGEELSAKQKQLAWTFIMNSFRSNDYQPNIFRSDIIVNLKGQVTSEDSVFVKSLISQLQEAIPYLKIELSELPGNFILGLNDGKHNTVTTNMDKNHAINNIGVYLPVPEKLSTKERKQFIYFHFFQGFTSFFYPKIHVFGLEGCIFTEKDFKSVTFSPVDIYIIQELYSPDLSILLAENLDANRQQLAWKFIQSKFINGLRDPLIFQDAILLKLTGNVSGKDSVLFKKIIDELNEILPDNRKIVLSTSDANLTIKINTSRSKHYQSTSTRDNAIIDRKLSIYLPKGADDERRLKNIYYYLYRSLVSITEDNTENAKEDGCVFNEINPEAIGFHPYDKFLLSKLYAPDFQQQLKSYFIKTSSLKEYYRFRFKEQLPVLAISGGLILSIILISFLILLNVFHKHNWNFRSFLIQVIWGIIAYDIFFLFNHVVQSFEFKFHQLNLIAIITQDLTILAVSIVSFLVEKKIHLSSLSSRLKFFLLLMNTVFISYTSLYLLLHFYTKQSGLYIVFFCTFTTLIITTARFFMMSLSGINKAEINEKESEIILLREKNKQAELQSLRAKINPHFLYNALNSIASLATTDGQKTEQMALSLSDFFKYAINREQKQLNTLSEELNAIRTYLEIEKVRFGARLDFEIDCPTELRDIQIPQLLIQPLVENALKHGLSHITDKGFIKVAINKENDQLKIRVYDNGPAFPEGPLSGFGIQNTQERISLIYGAQAGINWQNEPQKYIEISLPVNN